MSSGLGTLACANMVGMDKEPSSRLKQAVTKYRRAEAAVIDTRDEVYAAILADLADGVRQADIVRATGLTRERIRQIVNADKEKRGGEQ
jgi:hypothetical protein